VPIGVALAPVTWSAADIPDQIALLTIGLCQRKFCHWVYAALEKCTTTVAASGVVTLAMNGPRLLYGTAGFVLASMIVYATSAEVNADRCST